MFIGPGGIAGPFLASMVDYLLKIIKFARLKSYKKDV